jgi:hypothetical protein
VLHTRKALSDGLLDLLKSRALWLRQKEPLPVERVALICQQIVVSPVIEP